MLVAKTCLNCDFTQLLTNGEETCHILLVTLGITIANGRHIDMEIIQHLRGDIFIAHFDLSFPQRIAQYQLFCKHSGVSDARRSHHFLLLVLICLFLIGSFSLLSPHIIHVEVYAKLAHLAIIIDVGMVFWHSMHSSSFYCGNFFVQLSIGIRCRTIIGIRLLQSSSIHIVSTDRMMLVDHPRESKLAKELVVSHVVEALYILKPRGGTLRFHLHVFKTIEFTTIIVEIGE